MEMNESDSEQIELLQQIVSNMPNYVFWKDSRLVYRGCNNNFVRKVGFTDPKEIIGKTDEEMPWGIYTGSLYQEEDRLILKNGDPILDKEVPMILPGEGERVLLVSKAPLYDRKGNITGILGIYTDITERKRLEKELQESHAREEHFKTLSSVGNMIAHEMRTPLRAIDNGISGIKEYLPKLIEGYEKAKTEKLNVPFIHPMHYQALIANSENLGIEVRQAFLVIDMLLMKAKQQKMDPSKFTTHSMSEVVKTALERYPFTPEERAIVHVDISKDFNFKGDELAIVHVFFNLLKNALHYIKSANKGEVYITTTLSGKFNELHFKDTGPGISKENLAKLFDAFFTSGNAHGTGLGLAFCKMVMQGLGGDITCDSVEGEFTEFVLRFPT